MRGCLNTPLFTHTSLFTPAAGYPFFALKSSPLSPLSPRHPVHRRPRRYRSHCSCGSTKMVAAAAPSPLMPVAAPSPRVLAAVHLVQIPTSFSFAVGIRTACAPLPHMRCTCSFPDPSYPPQRPPSWPFPSQPSPSQPSPSQPFPSQPFPSQPSPFPS